MGQVRVVTDSGGDLAVEVVSSLRITEVPLLVLFGTQSYVDGELTIDEFWRKVSEGPHHPSTSQPSMGAFEEAFARLIEAGHHVLCITITGKHSGTFSTASAAAQGFGEKVKIVDSLSLSLGQGFQVLAAARAALMGLGLDEVIRVVERVRERSHLLILLDTVEFIRTGGRAASLMPVLNRVTKMLRIKPVLSLSDGRLSLHSMARSYERGLAQIKDEIAQLHPVESLAVVHTRSADMAHRVAETLAGKLSFSLEDVLVAETGPLLSTHAGAKVIGVAAVQRAL